MPNWLTKIARKHQLKSPSSIPYKPPQGANIPGGLENSTDAELKSLGYTRQGGQLSPQVQESLLTNLSQAYVSPFQQGMPPPGYRETVYEQLKKDYPKVPESLLNELVYKQVFPEGWEEEATRIYTPGLMQMPKGKFSKAEIAKYDKAAKAEEAARIEQPGLMQLPRPSKAEIAEAQKPGDYTNLLGNIRDKEIIQGAIDTASMRPPIAKALPKIGSSEIVQGALDEGELRAQTAKAMAERKVGMADITQGAVESTNIADDFNEQRRKQAETDARTNLISKALKSLPFVSNLPGELVEGAVEQTIPAYAGLGGNIAAGLATRLGVVGADDLAGKIRRNVADPLAEFANESQPAPLGIEDSLMRFTDPRYLGRGLASGVASFAPAVIGYRLAGPVGSATIGMLMEGGSAYQDAIAQGASEQEAERADLIVGTINGALNTFGAKTVLDKIPSLKGRLAAAVLKDVGKKAFVESSTETLQQLVSNSVAKVMYNSERSLGLGVTDSAFFGALIGGVAGAPISMQSGQAQQQQVQNIGAPAIQGAQQITDIGQQAIQGTMRGLGPRVTPELTQTDSNRVKLSQTPGVPKRTQVVPSISTELEPLAQEARKYKNVEEFQKSLVQSDNNEKAISAKKFPISMLKDENGNPLTLQYLEKQEKGIVAGTRAESGRAIEKPIAIQYNPSTETYGFNDGLHRITQAVLNGDEHIPAHIEIMDRKANSLGGYDTKSTSILSDKNKLTDFYNQAVEQKPPVKPAPRGLKPRTQPRKITYKETVGTPKLAEGVRKKAIRKKLIYGFDKSFQDLPEYNKANVKEQGKKATDIVLNDPAKAVQIAMGEQTPPDGVLANSVFVALENYAIDTKNVDLIRKLANSPLTLKATGMGQEIRMLAERNPESAVTKIREIVKVRRDAYEKRTGKKVDKMVKDMVKQVKVKKVARPDWNQFVESLRC